MISFDTIAKMSMGALMTIVVSATGQHFWNVNAKDECRLNSNLHLIYIDTFMGDAFECRSYK